MPLPELPEAPAGASDPIHIDFVSSTASSGIRWSTLWTRPNGSPWALVARSAGAYHVRIVGFAEFRVTAARVQVEAAPAARASTIRHLLLDQVLPLALAADGHLVLHASAVSRVEAGVMALAGAAGSGKSTMAAALRQEGWSVMADDGVLVQDAGEQVQAVPAYAGLRVWPDAVEAAGLSAQAVTEVAEYSAKLRVSEPAARHAGPAPLRSVYVLEEGDECRFEQLTPRDAAMALVRHAYRADLDDRAALAVQLDGCVRLAERVPVWRAFVPRELGRLAVSARALGAHATFDAS